MKVQKNNSNNLNAKSSDSVNSQTSNKSSFKNSMGLLAHRSVTQDMVNKQLDNYFKCRARDTHQVN